VKQAGDLEAVRAALQRLFAGFVLHRTDSEAAPTRQYLDLAFLGRGAEYVIEPLVQDQVIEGYTEKMTPILRREPLYKAENNDGVGLTTSSSAPRANPRTRSASDPRPVSRITGRFGSILCARPSDSRTRRQSS
jgi:hypothetical protein